MKKIIFILATLFTINSYSQTISTELYFAPTEQVSRGNFTGAASLLFGGESFKLAMFGRTSDDFKTNSAGVGIQVLINKTGEKIGLYGLLGAGVNLTENEAGDKPTYIEAGILWRFSLSDQWGCSAYGKNQYYVQKGITTIGAALEYTL